MPFRSAEGMETPRSENRALTRSRYVPTPKMSDRKKSLFVTESRDLGRNPEEDSDLGPMSPLKFSNSPKRGPMKVLNITSFRNILGNDSPDSDRSLSPDFERRFSHSDRYEIIPATYDKENQIMDEETRLSFPNGTPIMQAQAESALLDETNSNSLSMLMSSDLNIVDKKNPILKTPGLSDAAGQKKEPRTSFRKMSFLENTSTPTDGRKANSSLELSSESRARTSLSFNDIRPISTKSFYSSNASPDAIQKPVTKPIQTYSSISYGRLPQRRATSNPRKRQPAKKRNNSIRLGNFNRGVFHKIKKPTVKTTKATVKKLSTSQILESTASLLAKQPPPPAKKPVQSKSAPSSPQKLEPMKQHIERIKKILTRSRNPIELARPLSLSKSLVDLANGTRYEDDRESEESASEEEPGGSFEEANDSHDDEAKPEVGGRKFFKSSSSRRIKREYKVVNNVLATVRKGGQISLKPTKQKKRKYRSLFEEEFDFASEQLEVDDIINKLTGSQVELDPVCTGQSAPCGTSVTEPPLPDKPEATVQIEIIDALQSEISNDEPIAVQPNVIYVDRLSPLLNGASSTSEDSCSSSREIPFHEDNCMQTEYQESPTTQIRTMTSSLTITKSFNISDQLREESQSNHRLFPIFCKDHQRTLQAQFHATQDAYCNTLFDVIRRKPKRLRTARGVGSNQYQIDAGQKEYGAQQCPECGLVYSVHEPEEELIHENYHSSLHVLRFAGWSSEVVAGHIPEWDITGRVLVIGMTAGKHKLQKVQEVLAVVDRELGFVEPCRLVMGSVVYLAVARGTILGICVVQPLQNANRLLTIEGTEGSIDCCTMETYPAKCGISRVWVSPGFRGHGIARTLLTVMKSHFIFGYQMSYDEVAFSAPTEAGKRLAEAVTGRKDFLIYM
ncbi:N-acetyltransferase eco [Ochlerotatus camptorhynchus]|uniref:N-acetyltransferase eco n=1 Tax=Ochlerotatus camptorhynchus TaxID=644619 RepID=UPI0031D5B154